LFYGAAKMQKFFDVLFDAAYNIFLCVNKKDRRSHPKMQGLRRSFLRANRCLRGTFFNVSVRDLSAFCP
jgi:hypothetical protein